MGQQSPFKIYIHIKPSVYARPGDTIKLGQIATVAAPSELEKQLNSMVMTKVPESKKSADVLIVDAVKLIHTLQLTHPQYDIEHLGAAKLIVRVVGSQGSSTWQFAKVVAVSVLLFVGAAMTIMNFHADVAMADTQQTLYTIITGVTNPKPLALQIPYSIGIGVGMLMFFNHVFKKPLSNEPSPLELEMYLYEENLNQYLRSNQEQSEGGPE